MKIKKNKKGMLLASETLKVILSVISISILVFLLVALYFSFSDNKDLKEAEAVMEKMKFAFDSFKENGSQEFYGLAPSGWKIFSYADNEEKPNVCGGQDCICICDKTLISSQLKECTNSGVCEIFQPLIDEEDILIEKGGLTNIVVYKREGWFGVNLK